MDGSVVIAAAGQVNNLSTARLVGSVGLSAFSKKGDRLAEPAGAGPLPLSPHQAVPKPGAGPLSRGVLVRNRELAAEMLEAMGDRPVVLLRGHGLTSAAQTMEQAVLQAISVNTLAMPRVADSGRERIRPHIRRSLP
ncbi:class II aldolase/adducin family protein [Arthrobacter sp. Soil762]|uniref:class II aldolase/adducin family protein n=1 Tax=Arthrobacter sp. Soil762 TaxID=1736401 RepID=UPI0006FB3350|nr:class II aldolase/adducin family protein [Arthrobacter sp. Soil762]KRE75990.1 hypothetical protein ASG77_20420 [Arthrobacter sp. Soil762]